MKAQRARRKRGYIEKEVIERGKRMESSTSGSWLSHRTNPDLGKTQCNCMHTYMLCFHLIVRETNISAFYQTTAPSILFKHTLSSTISFIKDIGNYEERHP